MATMPAAASMMKKAFCLEHPEKCARFQLAFHGIVVPSNLYPNQVERAKMILAGK
ncbi:MAG: hypothetical protein WA354_08390 [Terracidiphilus sp.]